MLNMKRTSSPNHLQQFNVIVLLSVAYLKIATVSEAIAVTNKMRYGTNKEKTISGLPLEQVVELTASTTRFSYLQPSPLHKKYMLYTKDKQPGKQDNIKYKSLDEEDKRLLEKFYGETKNGVPFLGDFSSTQNMWDDQENGGLSALLDGDSKLVHTKEQDYEQQAAKLHTTRYWTHEPNLAFGYKKFAPDDNKNVPSPKSTVEIQAARYSPSLRLLTSYNPVAIPRQLGDCNDCARPKDNRLVGATLYGQNKYLKPEISSKSAVDAIKLHNDLMNRPPNDGIVRVRMYYHRAIHDDARLYGTGPWKYWGHGWGLEFGYDPKSEKKDKDFYQKGYTIERAFGRDFCIDKNNCRHSDPNFFNDPHDVGKYSKQHAPKIKQPKKLEIKKGPNEYRRL